MKTKLVWGDPVPFQLDWDLKDATGRAVGFVGYYRTVERVEDPVEGTDSPYTYPMGLSHIFYGVSSRNGAPFGSAWVYLHGPDKEGVSKIFEERVAKARKNAVRKFS